MKRLTLLTILLVVVGLTAGALEVKPAFTLSGSGTLQWGIDLDTDATGFKNSFTSDLVVTLMAADGTDTHAGTGDWYGWIKLSDVDASLDAANTVVIPSPTVEAKIVGLGGALAIGVYPAPDTGSNTDFVAAIEADAETVPGDGGADLVLDDETGFDVDTSYPLYGTYVSYTLSEALMVGLEVVSANDWTLNAANAYAFALDVTATFDPLTIKAGVNYGFNYAANPIGLGLLVKADTAMVDAWVGFDGQIVASTFEWEAGAGVTFTFLETVLADFWVVYNDTAFGNLDLMFKLTEPAAKGLVDNLDASLTVYLLDVAGVGDIEYEIIFQAGYLMGKLYPSFGVTYGDPNEALVDPFLKMWAHVDYTLFDAAKTVLSLGWDSKDLLATPAGMGTIIAGVTITY